MSEDREAKAPSEDLLARVERLEAIEAVRRLQSAYAYYLDASQGEAALELFADEAIARFFGGIFRGKDSLRRFYVGHSRKFLGLDSDQPANPTRGRMGEHLMVDMVVTVSDDRRSAKARVHHTLKAGWHEKFAHDAAPGAPLQWFEGGTYENEYVREGQVWKFKTLDLQIEYAATPEWGWAHTPVPFVPSPLFTTTFPENPFGPDELIDPRPIGWPERVVLPYHFPHPVTGAAVHVDGERKLQNP